ncbi:MAG: SGNH/GDSL hydrolase family protein, partial [Armatimonadetes bacterium]|nr:SGNH/GDSL hydrolase family protein [Armatimonadota bacterium]
MRLLVRLPEKASRAREMSKELQQPVDVGLKSVRCRLAQVLAVELRKHFPRHSQKVAAAIHHDGDRLNVGQCEDLVRGVEDLLAMDGHRTVRGEGDRMTVEDRDLGCHRWSLLVLSARCRAVRLCSASSRQAGAQAPSLACHFSSLAKAPSPVASNLRATVSSRYRRSSSMVRLAVFLLLVTAAHACLAQETPQRNLVTFFSKCRAGGPVTVAYIGGSITAQDGWRPFTTKWLQEQFKGLEIKEVNAAIGGTGSLLGVFRLQKHVLQSDPDLVFVEFAVNDNGTPDDSVHATMEGIVRQCWAREKKPDLVFTFTTAHTLQVPTARHQAVADAYGIPTVDFQKSVQAVCLPGLIDWEILAGDRVHPNSWGHAIYAATLATFLKQQLALTEAVPPPDALPAPAFSGAYQTARLETVADRAPDGWEVKEAAGMFRDGSIMASQVGQ